MIDELRPKYQLRVLLKVSGLAKSTYEYYKSTKHITYVIKKAAEDKEIFKLIKEIYDDNKSTYGYRRVYLKLKETLNINHKRVQRLMSINNLKGLRPKVKYHSYKGDNGLFKKNLLLYETINPSTQKSMLKRDFKANKPNEKWTTDVSEFHILKGKLYLSPIMDMYDNYIISYDISKSPNFAQTTRMLDAALEKYPKLEGLTFHSDQGWQYQHPYYQKQLKNKGIKQSFSRKGNCINNAVMESFFGRMKTEMFYGQEYKYKTLEDLKQSMINYIDYYNNKRISLKRKGLTPLQLRNKSMIL